MARGDEQQALMPSLIDRLIDPNSGGTTANPGYSLEQMFVAVQRDLEDLLNTRKSVDRDMATGVLARCPELATSIFGFGLPDLVSLNTLTPDQREEVGRVLERAVNLYEPRLRDVHARLISTNEPLERSLKFHIEGRLCLDPAPEVAFDTVLELTTGRYSVKAGQS